MTTSSFVGARVVVASPRRVVAARAAVSVRAASWTKTGLTTEKIAGMGGRTVVELANQKILLQVHEGTCYAVSNKCSHLGLPMEGKLLKGEYRASDGCVSCKAHNTFFDVKTGAVVGDWAPAFPDLPFVGKGAKKPLPTYQLRTTGTEIEILI